MVRKDQKRQTRTPAPRINFTKKALETIRPPHRADRDVPAPRLVYWDTRVTGLCLRVSETGAKTFSVHRRVKNANSTSTVTIGRFPDVSIEMARAEAEKLGGEYATGIDPAKKRTKARRELTFGELFEEYIKRMVEDEDMRRPEKKRGTYNLYLSHWGNRKLRNIESTEVADWYRALPAKIVKERDNARLEKARKAKAEGRTIAPNDSPNKRVITGKSVANQAIKLLRVLYRKAIDDWELYEGRVPGIKIKLYPESARKRFIQKGEMPEFFKSVFLEKNTDIRDYVLLSLLTGGRRSNVLAMEWGELQLVHGQGEWKIPKEKAKMKEDMHLPLIDEAVALLLDRKRIFEGLASKPIEPPERGGQRAKKKYEFALRMRELQGKFVFPGTGEHGHMVEPKNSWHAILKRAGIKNLRLHDLRRTLGSWQAKQGTNLRIIQDSLSHGSLDATMIYTHLDLDPVRESVAKATAAMFAAAEPDNKGAEIVPIKKAAA